MLNIFETPYLMISLAALTLIILTLSTNIKSSKRIAIFLLILALGFACEYFIQTDNEKINSAIEKGRQAIVTLNIPQISAILDNDYRDSHHKTKESAIKHCRQVLNKPLVEKIKFIYLDIQIDDTSAKAVFEAVAHIDQSSVYSDYGQVVPFKMQLDFIKRNKQWFVKSAEILEVNKQKINWNSVR